MNSFQPTQSAADVVVILPGREAGDSPELHEFAAAGNGNNGNGKTGEYTPLNGKEPDKNLARSWAQSGDKFWGIGATHPTLPANVYAVHSAPDIGIYLEKMDNKTDLLLKFPDSASDMVLQEMREFQGMKAKYEKYGFLHKRGILLYGPPGSGKTTTIQQLIDMVVRENDGIALFLDHPIRAAQAMRMIRSIEPERQILGIMEDFDGLLQAYGDAGFLALLDGEAQVDNVVMVATTNYVGHIDKRFTDRPSRFDLVTEIAMPSAAAREVYLTAKIPDVTPETLAKLVKVSDGYSVAHLRELIILTQVYGVSLEDAAARLKKLERLKEAAPERGKRSMGFDKKSVLD